MAEAPATKHFGPALRRSVRIGIVVNPLDQQQSKIIRRNERVPLFDVDRKRPVTTPCRRLCWAATSRAQSKQVGDGAGVEASGLGEAGGGFPAQRVVATGVVWRTLRERVFAGRMAMLQCTSPSAPLMSE